MMIDVNVSLFRWPFRRLPLDEPSRLVERLRAAGVSQAWAGSLEGPFHRDLAGVNARLAEECRRWSDLLLPFGSVNPLLPDWQEDLRRCQEVHRMRGIRLHPNYHGYPLDQPEAKELIAEAVRRGFVIQIATYLDDPRFQPLLGRVPDVDLKPLGTLAAEHPGGRFVVLNGLRGGTLRGVMPLASRANVALDIASLEGAAGLELLLGKAAFDQGRVLFGSHAPLFYLESALLKLQESRLTPAQREAITHGNAERLLAEQGRAK